MAAADTVDRAADQAGDLEDQDRGKDRFGRALDVAGVCAGIVLGIILFDIFSGGRLTKWARARRGPGPDDKGPCEGCSDDDN